MSASSRTDDRSDAIEIGQVQRRVDIVPVGRCGGIVESVRLCRSAALMRSTDREDSVAARAQFRDEVPADEAVSAGDERAHRNRRLRERERTQPCQVGGDHLLDERFEGHFRFPTQRPFCFGWVADQQVDFRRPHEARVFNDIALVL